MTTTTVPAVKTESPHAKPAAASAVGVILGALAVAWGFFTGHPAGEAVAAIGVGGTSVAASVAGFIAHHASWLRTAGPLLAADLPAVEEIVRSVPGLSERLGEVEHTVAQRAEQVAPPVDVEAVAAAVKRLILADAVTAAPAQADTSPAAGAMPAESTPPATTDPAPAA